MRSFTDLAKDYQFSPVRSADGELAGYLHLDAKATKAALSSRQFHHFDDGDNGWFDLEIEDHRGSRILLHNALTQSEVMPGSASGRSVGSYTSEIFPNVVVFGTENLRNDQTLHQMAFEFEGAENFFVYNTIEWHSFYRQQNKLGVLNSIRKESWKPPKEMGTRNHLDDPYDIYVIHKPRCYI